MTQYKDQHVKLLLNNNILIEGVVQVWSDSSVEILSLDKQSTSIILHPKEDIRVIKVIHQKELIKEKSITEKKFEEVSQQVGYDDLKIKKLSELKVDLIKQDKEIVANKLKQHQLSEVKKVNYDYPGFFKK